MLYHQNMINLRNERGIRIIIVIIIFVINFKQINNKFFKLKELILPFCCICIIFVIVKQKRKQQRKMQRNNINNHPIPKEKQLNDV